MSMWIYLLIPESFRLPFVQEGEKSLVSTFEEAHAFPS